MTKRNHFVLGTILLIFVAAFLPSKAQFKKDSTKKILLAKLTKKETPVIVLKEANVIYPDIAVQNAEIVIQEWIETAQELGRPIPQPKGRLLFA